MTLEEAIKARHSVRQYQNKPLDKETITALQAEIEACNREGDLHIQLVTNEPKAFDGFMAHYGKFSGVTSYIAMIGKKERLDEKCGYYGERLVLLAQQLGLNTCWVAMTYKKIPGTFEVNKGEKLTVVISLGYGKAQGVEHKSKPMNAVSNINPNSPEWFKKGVEAALLAPTAMNQQKFMLVYEDGKITATASKGF